MKILIVKKTNASGIAYEIKKTWFLGLFSFTYYKSYIIRSLEQAELLARDILRDEKEKSHIKIEKDRSEIVRTFK